MTRTARTVVPAALALVVLLAGCGADESDPATADAPVRSQPAAAGDGELSAFDHESITELSEGARVVLVGNVSSVDEARLHGSPVYEVTVDVDRVARGDVPEQITVREFPVGGGPVPRSARVTVGQRYLLFLVDTEVPGDPPHYYYTFGAGGLYALDGAQGRRVDPGESKLPVVVDLEQVLKVAESQTYKRPPGPGEWSTDQK